MMTRTRARRAQLYFLKPRCALQSRKHCLHSIRSYLRIRPERLEQRRHWREPGPNVCGRLLTISLCPILLLREKKEKTRSEME